MKKRTPLPVRPWASLLLGFHHLPPTTHLKKEGLLQKESLTITLPISHFECPCKPQNQSEFFTDCWKSLHATTPSRAFSPPRMTLYQEFMERVMSGPLCGWLSFLATELRSFWSWAPLADFQVCAYLMIDPKSAISQSHGFHSRLGRYAQLSSVGSCFRRLISIPDIACPSISHTYVLMCQFHGLG